MRLPDIPSGRQAAWVISQISNPPHEATDDDLNGRFATQFLSTVPLAQVRQVLSELTAKAPWAVIAVSRHDSAVELALTSPHGDLTMTLDTDDEGLISTLRFAEPLPPRMPAASWQELGTEIESLAAQTSLFVAEVSEGGRCVPLPGAAAGSDAGERLPIGSIVKLYVLGAIADAVQRHDLDWSNALTISDHMRSLPSGKLQNQPDGSQVSVQEAAELMISISDNTAMDLLVEAVGRHNIEQALTDMGNSAPQTMVPLPTTRELFWVGWGGGEQLRERWARADPSQRVEILTEVPPRRLEIAPDTIAGEVAWTSGVDWFASGADVCAAHVALAERSTTQQGAPLAQILSANPGVDVKGLPWSYVAFKGGSSVGTNAGSWYARDEEGHAVVVVIQTASADLEGSLATDLLASLAHDALCLAAVRESR